ncbi:MAG: alpha/beta hydrolase [Chloroflexota bacterium]|nr:alpha/beta hydrolase [Chloroflexota bacterium]
MRLDVQEFGPSAGRTVVALHGVTGSPHVFRRLAHRLPSFHFVAPAFRGHGASPKEPPWDLSAHLRDVRETLDARGISRAPFIGFSFGGRVAVELLVADRSRIERLVLLDPALRVDPQRALAITDGLLADTSYGSTEEAIQARIDLGLTPYAPREHWDIWAEDLVEGPDGRLRLPFSRPAAMTIYSELTTPPPPFASLRLPTLLIVGAESPLVTPQQIERYKYELADFLEVKSVRAKHQLIGDAADEVAAAVGAFLAR